MSRDYLQSILNSIIILLSGTWTYVGEEMEEPFFGERHWLKQRHGRNWKIKFALQAMQATRKL